MRVKKGDKFHGRCITVAYRPSQRTPDMRGEAVIAGVRFSVGVWFDSRDSLSLGLMVEGAAHDEKPEEYGIEFEREGSGDDNAEGTG